MSRAPLIAALFLLLAGCDLPTTGDEDLPDPQDVILPDSGGGPDVWQPVCEPGATRCEDLQRAVCLPGGDGWSVSACPPGSGCLEDGVCEIAHPRVLVVFDSSGSMLGAAVPGTVMEEPVCGMEESPGSRLEASKTLFRFLFEEPLATTPRMALFRFPQYMSVAPECEAGLYSGGIALSGDDGSHEVDASVGGWFRTHLRQVMLSGLPAAPSNDGRAELLTWLDGGERIAQTVVECSQNSDCDDRLCQGGFCHRQLDPELRGAGNTPLGKTLFYVGEYLRTQIFIDGRSCDDNTDCVAQGYRCGDDGTCYDPLESCRTNHIVVFTDGQETVHVLPGDFFNPFQQARRLRWGLGCESDDDCLGEAVCGDAGSCRPPGEAPADPSPTVLTPDITLDDLLDYSDPEGVQQLVRADGVPVPVQVHVLDVWGSPDAELLAWFGGGQYVTGTVTDPDAVLYEMDLLFRSKAADLICEPLR